jgi:hypothetical protein
MKNDYLLALWIDVDSASRDVCDHWYVHKHIAERMRLPGWRSARRFRAIGTTQPATLALYDVDTAEQLVSEAFLDLQRQVDENDRRMRATFSNVVRGTFRVAHHHTLGEGGSLLSLRFRAEDALFAGGGAERWVASTLMPQLEALPGVVGIRLAISEPELRERHDANRKSGNEDAHAHWVLLIDVTEDDRLQPVVDHLINSDGLQRLCREPVVLGRYRLIYTAQSESLRI